MFDLCLLLLVSLKMLGLDQKFENDNTTRISEHTLNYTKIISDREKRLMLHLIVLILKTFQTSMKDSEVFNVDTSTNFGKLIKKQNALRNVLNIIFIRNVNFYSCLRCCNMSTDTPSCFTKLAVCSKIQERLGFSERVCSRPHCEDEQSRLLLHFLFNSALFSQSLSSLALSLSFSAGTT